MTSDEIQVGFYYGIGEHERCIKVVVEEFLYEKANEIRYRVAYFHPCRTDPGRYMSPRKAKDIRAEAINSREISIQEVIWLKGELMVHFPELEDIVLTNKL